MANSDRLRCDQLTLAYDQTEVIRQLSLEIPTGQITTLIGPNGCGKSTLLKGLARLMPPKSGAAYLDGKAIHQQSTRQVARQLAVLLQNPEAPEGLSVRELLALGRYPHQGFFGTITHEDEAKIDDALEMAGIQHLAERPLGELSGGQRQLAWIAMALAQDAEILLLDEPTTFLDMVHQLEVLNLLERLHQGRRRTIVLVLHDINHAARFSQHLIALREGRIVRSGSPREIVTRDLLADVFQVEAAILTDPHSDAPYCIPLRPMTETLAT
ncbi:ABC transporter ATP-binding protein [Blastopirellula sp. JC732]|uniref:ABC transporter ATP-binding protein n=1 Tax=Blastopirellula sediminis TaxID=2894196 RepID=A0A9X1MQC2_9BACT|nr:ABC transporter ATP-binding protein [Blastopirellula sediminis]MCC9606190.1 ABC transporter ATP-binding protein [Blastopirellula sediminis]MCC9630512.1 ABC transporter ATP-binding protein [Blastopirellula sediminis]